MNKGLINIFQSIFLLAFLYAGSGVLFASDTIPDSKGKDFWFCFPPNYHTDIDSRTIQEQDSLYVFVVAERPCSFTLTRTDINGSVTTFNQTITDPRRIATIGMPFWRFELIGMNRGNTPSKIIDQTGGQGQRKARQSFHLEATDDVTVYALSQAQYTSDAFLVLPTDALGTKHFVMSYSNDPGDVDRSNFTDNTPSQYAIVAPFDSTVIYVKNSTRTFTPMPDTIRLNRGDVFLVQSAIGNSSSFDLTGSQVDANKPIALFAGHQRTVVPGRARGQLESRDCLIEQMPPVSTWGKNAVIAPYQPQPILTPGGEDRYRVLAAYDSTEVRIDGVGLINLNKGQFYEGDANNPIRIKSKRPILVAQYKRTSTNRNTPVGANPLLVGDPFMMIISPPEQFLNSYRFINAQAFEDSSRLNQSNIIVDVYKQQFVNVVALDTTIASISVDGVPVNVSDFRKIPNSEYSYAILKMRDGAHEIKGDSGIGIYVYGYGSANSYGYVGGMAFKLYDFNAPQLFADIRCYEAKGMIFDTNRADSKIEYVRLRPDSTQNVDVQVSQFRVPADSISYTAKLIDEFQDGFFMLEAEDKEFFIGRRKFDIPGFTIRFLDENNIQQRSLSKSFKGATNRAYCRTVKLINVGKFNQKVDQFEILGTGNASVSSSVSFPFTVIPGDTATIELCYKFSLEGDYADTINIVTPCGIRRVGILDFVIRDDKTSPEIGSNRSRCLSDRLIFLRDSGDFASGVSEIVISDTINVSLKIDFDVDNTIIRGTVNDERFDAKYTLSVRDSSGNRKDTTVFIPGFSVMFSNVDSLQPRIVFQNTNYKERQCDTVELFNYGFLPKIFSDVPRGDEIYLNTKVNTMFSVPLHQLPFTLQAGERRRIEVCYYPTEVPPSRDSLWYDTLQLESECRIRNVIFIGNVAPRDFYGDAECDIDFRVSSEYPGKVIEASPLPQPANNQLTVNVNTAYSARTSFELISTLGDNIPLGEYRLSAGKSTVSFPINTISSGLYTLVVRNIYGQITVPCMIVK